MVHKGSPRHFPTIDLQKVVADVDREVNFLHNAEYAMRSPRLKEDVGVYASNGLVPVSLHKEVGYIF